MNIVLRSDIFNFDKTTNTFSTKLEEIYLLSSVWDIKKNPKHFYIESTKTKTLKHFNYKSENNDFILFTSNCNMKAIIYKYHYI
jgi:hypothetical protein